MLRLTVALLLAISLIATPARAFTLWTHEDLKELLEYVERVSSHGLDPADYDVEELRLDVVRPRQDWDARAGNIFLHLAADLSRGHVGNRSARAWYIEPPSLSEDGRVQLLVQALGEHRVRETLEGLAPRHVEYARLRAALAATPAGDREARLRLRANLERWRWMPRELGDRYLLVNVPAYTVTLFEGSRPIWTRRVIVGKPETPTPQFSAIVTGVIFNPWWDVPDSIVRESVGRLVRTQPALARQKGYVIQNGRYRQRPGPGNALGQAKLVMPNAYRVYLHDTPTKALFDEPARAFSHGCVRTQDMLGFAEDLLAGTPGWSGTDIERAVAAGTTTQANLARPLPIYIGYFTAAAAGDGAMRSYPDIYKRDASIVAQLVDRGLN